MNKSRSFRAMITRYEKGFLVGLVIVLLVIFVVVSDITDLMGGHHVSGPDREEIAGAFSVLPGERREVTYAEHAAARDRYETAARFFYGEAPRVASAVWTHLALLEAAKREGLRVSDAELRNLLARVLPPEMVSNRALYVELVRKQYGAEVGDFEESIREFLLAHRMRDVCADSFQIAPPLARQELFDRYANQNAEYARVSWCARDAKDLLADARAELDAMPEADREKRLQEFFDKDPAVKAEAFKFQHPRRFKFELLYVPHKRLFSKGDTVEERRKNWLQVEALFRRVWPDKPVEKLEGRVKDLDEYAADPAHAKRLLAYFGTTFEDLVADPKTPLPEVDEKDEESRKRRQEAEEKAKEELRDARQKAQRELIREAVDCEVRVLRMMDFFCVEARKDEKRSLKALYDQIQKHDDPAHPICSTEPGKGLLVYREFPQGISLEEMQALEDDGVVFGMNFSQKITGTGDKDLPKVGIKAELLGGPEGTDGRMIFRVVEVEKERRKTFTELTPGEKEILRDSYYLPERSRERARAELEELKKQFGEGGKKPEEFRAVAAANGRRVHENQWIYSTEGFRVEPSPKHYWSSTLRMMRDRHALHEKLESVLRRDQKEKKLGPMSLLDVQLASRTDPTDPGTAYLVLLLERKEPTAETVATETLGAYLEYARQVRKREEADWWTEDFGRIAARFHMEFFGVMQEQVDREEKERKQREANRG